MAPIDYKNTKALETAFFLQEDQILIQRLREMQKMQETKEALSRVSGIKNDHVLEKLVKLDVHPEIVASLAVVPLVEVAWADGNVDDKERAKILSLIEAKGIDKGGVEYQIVERWLLHRPEAKLLDAWTHYVEGLRNEMTAQEFSELREELLHHTRSVAEASGGGLFGLFSRISKNEKDMLQRLEDAFK